MLKKALICGSILTAAGAFVAWPGNASLPTQLLRRAPREHTTRPISQSELDAILDIPADTPAKHNAEANYNAEMGQALVKFARNHTSGTRWNCYAYVARAIHAQTGPFLEGMHAYMAANQLAENPHFQEITVPVKKLKELPAGAIVVWDHGKARSGHISIADGTGHEISDHVAPQMLAHYGGAGHRTFLPVQAPLQP